MMKDKGRIIFLTAAILILLISFCHTNKLSDVSLTGNRTYDYTDPACDSDEEVIHNPDCFKIYSDTHLFGDEKDVPGMKMEINNNIRHLNPANPSYMERTFYLGDIIDLSGAEEKDEQSARDEISRFRKAFGKNYVRGNHEMDAFGEPGSNRYMVYNGNILFMHGHQLRYPEDRTNFLETPRKDENAKKEWGKSRSTDELFLEGVRLAKAFNCRTVVFGHTHPDSLEIRNIDGIRLINVRKGCTYLLIPQDTKGQESLSPDPNN